MPRLKWAASASLAVATVGLAPAIAFAQCSPATRALRYLVSVQKPDGAIDDAIGETADFVLSATATGYDPNTLRSSSGKTPFDWFTADLQSNSPTITQTSNSLGKVVQAVVAGKHDPTTCAGQNLVARLQQSYNAATGAFCVSGDTGCVPAKD